MVKRVTDFLFALMGLVIALPFFLFIGLLVKIDSTGPVLYLQQRVGKNKLPFTLFKFRTMHIEADKKTAITVGNRDPRITRIGYYLRKFKVDELPQLINVLVGDMSLVGPRPELKKFVDLYNEQQQSVLSVRPGLTDLASIQFRNENELLEGKADPIDFYIHEIMPVKLKLNMEYIASQSFWLDIQILFRTFLVIIMRK